MIYDNGPSEEEIQADMVVDEAHSFYIGALVIREAVTFFDMTPDEITPEAARKLGEAITKAFQVHYIEELCEAAGALARDGEDPRNVDMLAEEYRVRRDAKR